MTEDELFGMMKITKDLQAAAKTAIDGIAAERVALGKDRAAMSASFAQQAELVKAAAGSVSTVATNIRQAAAQAIPAIQEAAGAAVGASVSESLSGASEAAVGAIGEAAKPLLGKMSKATGNAQTAAENLESAAKWLSWKAGCFFAAGMAGLLLAAFMIFTSLVWWQGSKLQDLRKEEAELQARVADLQGSADLLKRGNYGVWVKQWSDGKYAYFPNGYDAVVCNNNVPCVKLK